MNSTTIGVFHTKKQAESAISDLRQFGIDDTTISYMYSNKDGEVTTENASGEIAEDTAKGVASGATTGAIVGALAGLAVVNGILPGLGSLFVAGPLATALGLTGAAATTVSGALTGAAAGGLVGGLTGLGVSASEAKKYEDRVTNGDILVAVDSSQPQVKQIFEKHQAEEIGVYEKNR